MSWININAKKQTTAQQTWQLLKGKMEDNCPFCYVRFNEGESRMVANIPGSLSEAKKVRTLDSNKVCDINKVGQNSLRKYGRWHYNQKEDTKTHQLIFEALIDESSNYFASLCDPSVYYNYRYHTLNLMNKNMEKLPSIILNAHMPHHKDVHEDLLKFCNTAAVNMIVNEEADVDKLPFKPKSVWRVSNVDALRKDLGLIEEISEYIEKNDVKKEMFVCGAGPFTNILLHQLWKRNPTNYYIDTGSTYDYFLFGVPTRGWLTKVGDKRGPELR